MDGHNPDLLAAAVALALDFRVTPVEPCKEFLQTPALLMFKLQRGIQHLFNGDQNFTTQTRGKLTPRTDGAGQYLFQEMINRREIGHRKHIAQRGDVRLKLWPVTNMLPQAPLAVADIAILEQCFLRPTNDRRNQQTGQTEVVIGLQHKFDRGQQILHHQRLQQTKPVNTCNGNIAFMQLRHQHRRHVTTAAQ